MQEIAAALYPNATLLCCTSSPPERPAHVLPRAEIIDRHGQHGAGVQLDVYAPAAAAAESNQENVSNVLRWE